MDYSGAYGLVIILVIILIYFLPGLIANGRDHKNTAAIFILNLFLGWTALGWIISLVWAFTDNVHRRIDTQGYDEMGYVKKEPILKNKK